MNSGHYNALKVLSYNGIFTQIITNRNYGKTWGFKKRAWKRGLKHGKKTIWLRTFKKEVKEAIASFYTSIDLQKFCGIVPYDAKTKQGNFKQNGNTFYVKRGNKWVWFLKVFAISDANGIRGADDVDIDTIVWDEFTTTAQRLKRYHGNIMTDFIDIYMSIKREHEVRCFLLGNKENVLNPFLSYFGVKPISSSFEGIKQYRNGSLIIQQINNKPKEQTTYEKKLKSLLNGTAYGDYIYKDTYKNERLIKRAKPPPNANEYIQLDINGIAIKIWVYNGLFYITSKIDVKRRVYTLDVMNKYKYEYLLLRKQKRFFTAIENAIADGRVYYENQIVFEAIQPFYKWLSI